MEKIRLNKIRCNHCGDIIVSEFAHDYNECSCGRVAVDGGKEYLRRVCMDMKNDFTELSEYEDEKIVKVETATQCNENMERLLEIWESAVRKTHTFLCESDIVSIKKEVPQAIMSVKDLYCFTDDNGIIQGFIGVENQKIEMLFIDVAARGQGIGKKLLNHAATASNAIYVDVNEQNEQGVGFYEHMGFFILSRSDYDEQNRPFPILHMKLNQG